MDELEETQVNELMKKFYFQLKKINKKNIVFFQSAFPISSTFTKMKSFQYINPVGNRVPKYMMVFIDRLFMHKISKEIINLMI